MPTRTSRDSKGCFARWGSSGKKYYYKCGDKKARDRAKAKADRQGRAAHAGGRKSSENPYKTGYLGKLDENK